MLLGSYIYYCMVIGYEDVNNNHVTGQICCRHSADFCVVIGMTQLCPVVIMID